MSVLDALSSELFEQMLEQLDKARGAPSRVAQTDEEIIQEINRLAEQLLPSEVPPLEALDESLILLEAGVGTNQSSFLEKEERRGKQYMSATGSMKTSRLTGMQLRPTGKTSSYKRSMQSTGTGKSTLNGLLYSDPPAPIQHSRLHEDARARHNQKTEAFVQSEVQAKAKEAFNASPSLIKKVTKIEATVNKMAESSMIRTNSRLISRLAREESELYPLSVEKRESLFGDIQHHSLETVRRGTIYERSQIRLAKKEQFITLKRQESQLKEIAEIKQPKINNNMQIEGDFQARLALAGEKSKINKALIAHKQLLRSPYQPKLTSKGWKVESKVKTLWTKKSAEHQTARAQPTQDKQEQKSLNSTAMQSLKLSMLGRQKAEQSRQQTIEIKFAQDLDFLLS